MPLIVIDEADRLKMAGLERVCAILDQGGMGLVLMRYSPGPNKQPALGSGNDHADYVAVPPLELIVAVVVEVFSPQVMAAA